MFWLPSSTGHGAISTAGRRAWAAADYPELAGELSARLGRATAAAPLPYFIKACHRNSAIRHALHNCTLSVSQTPADMQHPTTQQDVRLCWQVWCQALPRVLMCQWSQASKSTGKLGTCDEGWQSGEGRKWGIYTRRITELTGAGTEHRSIDHCCGGFGSRKAAGSNSVVGG